MKTVHSMPDDLYKRLEQLAHANNRSLSVQAITMLTQAVEDEERRKKKPKF